MLTRVKICGITRREDAELAIELGAAALGFNFYPPSPRYIEPAAARAIVQVLPPLVMTVAVFAVVTDVERLVPMAAEAGVSALQVDASVFLSASGNFGRYPVIITVRVRNGSELRGHEFVDAEGSGLPVTLTSLPRAMLLDTFHPEQRGGTGKTFDWKLARQLAQHSRVILAGGLTPENVGEAIRTVRPFAVDVASGVESAPGVKDAAKLRAFFAAAEHADRMS